MSTADIANWLGTSDDDTEVPDAPDTGNVGGNTSLTARDTLTSSRALVDYSSKFVVVDHMCPARRKGELTEAHWEGELVVKMLVSAAAAAAATAGIAAASIRPWEDDHHHNDDSTCQDEKDGSTNGAPEP